METMKGFIEFYNIKVEELKKEHNTWVNSNKKMRSIELARREIKSEGDTDINPADEVLADAHAKEKKKNDKLRDEMYSLKSFLNEMEKYGRENGIELCKVIEIFGY